jgi:hypothetical protein
MDRRQYRDGTLVGKPAVIDPPVVGRWPTACKHCYWHPSQCPYCKIDSLQRQLVEVVAADTHIAAREMAIIGLRARVSELEMMLRDYESGLIKRRRRRKAKAE